MANLSIALPLHYPLFFFIFIFSNVVLFCSFPLLSAASNCIESGKNISSSNPSSNIISPNGTFEVGFFTPEGSLEKHKYLGIWYNSTDPKIVVWVGNRDRPIPGPFHASLAIKGGDARVVGNNNTFYWSTYTPKSFKSLPNVTVSLCISDKGNLILYNRNIRGNVAWQSFDSITDTFLPGMSSFNGDTGLNLISWKSWNNPALGNYSLLLQQPEGGEGEKLVIRKSGKLDNFWESESSFFDEAPPQALFQLFKHNESSDWPTRVVMNVTGQIQFWEWENRSQWSLVWEEPKDRCNELNVCGPFGSCNGNNGILCKCLPGFKPASEEKWKGGFFSDGCKAIDSGASDTNASFLRLTMMKVGKPPNYNKSNSDSNCKKKCLDDTTCVAYSCGTSDCSPQTRCMMWSESDQLSNLQEEYAGGYTIFFRPTLLQSNSRNCSTCGTYIIPYPLSTGADCGDSSYFHFHCNETTSQVSFAPRGTNNVIYNVTSIDPDGSKFFIQPGQIKNCDTSRLKSSIESLPFSVKNCSVKSYLFAGFNQSYVEIEMNWHPPPEPTCNTSSDCVNWPHSTCKAAKQGGQKRCLCSSRFKWDGSKLKCTKEFPLKIVLGAIAGALGLILLCGIFFIRLIREKRIARKRSSDSVEFKGDDTESIDVPTFNWEVILAATDNFADANKLGIGGFGTVYKGVLPDGMEIAVKRLSTISVQGVEEFKTEVVLIAKLQHRNLVRLLGYCIKAEEKILVYEFVPNGSLDTCLFDETCSVVLDWEKRFDIIFGIARGLLYLHQDSRLRVIHRDLKPSNILLDEELNPKIADFGIARIIGGKETEGSTKRVVGTYGYMSPEYAYEGLFSVKSDVFSFGVVVLETISGRRNSKLFQIEFGLTLLGQAWKLWNEGKALDLVGQTLKESCKSSEVLKGIHLALLCVQEEPKDRPTMSDVVMMLSSENASLPPPKQPAFSTKKELSETASSSSIRDSSLSDMITIATGR